VFVRLIVLLQWDGVASVSVIESGAGWWHIVAESSEADAHYSNLLPIEAVNLAVADSKLHEYAVSDVERQFFVENAVAVLSAPVFYVSPTQGYYDGNALIGLLFADDYSHV
jgi:hypothetical protein